MSRTVKKARRKKPTSAAFFDLDRTLMSGASGPVFSEALRDVGVMAGTKSPVESAVFSLFNVVGETRPSMMMARQGARFSKGREVAAVAQAAELAVPALLERVLPYVEVEFEKNRLQGRSIVIATTTPLDLVRPFAEALGVDHVIATEYGVRDGRYDGSIDGPFIWGKGKARAVREWAEANGIDLDKSSAYSDSYYDVPLLSVVGEPHAVNPDPRMVAIAALRRWPIRFFDAPPGVFKFAGIEPQRIAMMLARPELLPFVKYQLYGVKRIPSEGPAIIVGNHRSYFDPLAIGFALAKGGRPVRFLGKKEVFDAPIVGEFATAMGGIRVERGSGSGDPLRAAEEALEAGELVALMPQGTIPRGRAFYSPELKGRWGAARLAQATGAPVIPMGLWGTEKVWPRSARLPNVTNITNPPKVSIRVGRPVELAHDDLDSDTTRIMDAVSSLLPAEARVEREPTDEEIALALPPGADDVDAAEESDRRPGTD